MPLNEPVTKGLAAFHTGLSAAMVYKAPRWTKNGKLDGSANELQNSSNTNEHMNEARLQSCNNFASVCCRLPFQRPSKHTLMFVYYEKQWQLTKLLRVNLGFRQLSVLIAEIDVP